MRWKAGKIYTKYGILSITRAFLVCVANFSNVFLCSFLLLFHTIICLLRVRLPLFRKDFSIRRWTLLSKKWTDFFGVSRCYTHEKKNGCGLNKANMINVVAALRLATLGRNFVVVLFSFVYLSGSQWCASCYCVWWNRTRSLCSRQRKLTTHKLRTRFSLSFSQIGALAFVAQIKSLSKSHHIVNSSK